MISKYREFLEAEYLNRKFSFYEKVCNFFGRINIPLTKDMKEKFEDEINFCHLRVTPTGVFSTAVILPIILFVTVFFLFYLLSILSSIMVMILVALSTVVFYYLFLYTNFQARYFRAKAAAEMSLAVIYMAISLKINASLEMAVAFAAQNLFGPLGLDLKKILWDLETGGLLSVIDGLNGLSKKWKSESDEFVNAVSLLMASINQTPEMMDRDIKEAVMVMTDGTKFRMRRYALEMRSPLKILNAFGILLPMLGLIFFPVMIIFVPEVAKPELIIFSYIVLLPSLIYLFLRQYFFSKPYSYHQVEMKKLQEFKRQKAIAFYLSLAISLVSIPILIYKLSIITTIFSVEQFVYSFLVVVVLSVSVIVYSFLPSYRNLQKNDEILKMESELPVALYQLSISSDIGKPIEKNIEDIIPGIETLKISKVFKSTLYNIKTFGMTLESAIFEKKIGAIATYPSRMLTFTFRLIVDFSQRGMAFLSIALRSISEFLKDADEVNNITTEILSETTSDMEIQSLIFAPLSAGIVVGLMAIVIYIFAFFSGSMQSIQSWMGSNAIGSSGFSAFSFLFNLGKQIPFHYFQIIVGIYMIEMVFIISHFLGELKYGDDEVSKMFNLGKVMLVGIIIYSVTACLLYFGMSSLINLQGLGGFT